MDIRINVDTCTTATTLRPIWGAACYTTTSIDSKRSKNKLPSLDGAVLGRSREISNTLGVVRGRTLPVMDVSARVGVYRPVEQEMVAHDLGRTRVVGERDCGCACDRYAENNGEVTFEKVPMYSVTFCVLTVLKGMDVIQGLYIRRSESVFTLRPEIITTALPYSDQRCLSSERPGGKRGFDADFQVASSSTRRAPRSSNLVAGSPMIHRDDGMMMMMMTMG